MNPKIKTLKNENMFKIEDNIKNNDDPKNEK